MGFHIPGNPMSQSCMRFEHNTHCRQYQHEMLGKMRFVISAFFFLMMFSYTGELLDGSQASIRFNFVPLVQFSCSVFVYAAAYDPLDPNGNITIKWDIMSWTPDGYVAVVTMHNFQMYRHIISPGWTLGWTWAKKEVIWSMVGAQTTEQGDCSKFKGNIPHCCKKTPTVVDLLPGVPYNQQFSNCCKGGVVSSWGQDPAASVSAFQVSVGLAGTSNKTVKLPKNFTLLGPGPGYTCGIAKIVPPTNFLTPDRRRKTQALMTWNVTCTYSQLRARKNPSCCVSFSSFYNETITPCPSCACGCQNKNNCVQSDSKLLSMVGINTPRKDNVPLLQCTHHMCPVRVHWHLKINYKDYWRVKVSITNFNYRLNYTLWTLVVQHPNLNNVTQVFSFDYKPLVPYESINDTGMFYGMKFYNDQLMEAGPFGNVQSEVLFQKDNSFTFKQGWAFPRKVYFNGDECMLPLPETYPFLPNSAHQNLLAFSTFISSVIFLLVTVW
ncbi:COBRA-like protein 4 isoform X1 [Vitis vinifera]|uniref:COBRA-like protein 4 isoform X1 n=1 Tax=Vitis vinifera TaxID=29760 RepID=UPI00288330C1|nr:COBRA-like protein 4 isoform X1 [Vitis vinifera]